MQPTRFCLTLMIIVFLLGSMALVQAQENAAAPSSPPAPEATAAGELKEIDRPESADMDPTTELPAKDSQQAPEAQDADYWFQKGVLLSVYGNEEAAIGAFQKAASLAPQWSSPYFQLGVAFGENGQYAEALNAINKAIELQADQGAYYYGRGRVHLLSGDIIKALDDLQKAADLGNPDAIRYLKKTEP